MRTFQSLSIGILAKTIIRGLRLQPLAALSINDTKRLTATRAITLRPGLVIISKPLLAANSQGYLHGGTEEKTVEREASTEVAAPELCELSAGRDGTGSEIGAAELGESPAAASRADASAASGETAADWKLETRSR